MGKKIVKPAIEGEGAMVGRIHSNSKI